MQIISTRLPNELQQTQWSQPINQLLKIPILQGVAITDIVLFAATPKTFSTTLNRMQQGWFLTDNSSNAVIWRTQEFNAQTLTLESSANTTISIWVY